MVSMPVHLHQSIFVKLKPSSLYATFGVGGITAKWLFAIMGRPGHQFHQNILTGSVQLSSVHSQPPEAGAAPLLALRCLPRNGHGSCASSNDTHPAEHGGKLGQCPSTDFQETSGRAYRCVNGSDNPCSLLGNAHGVLGRDGQGWGGENHSPPVHDP